MSIITEALKKAEKERNKAIDSKEYLNKILGPGIDMSSYKKDAQDKQMRVSTVYDNPAPAANWRPGRSLMVSCILIISAVIFLSAMNVFIISSSDPRGEKAASGEVRQLPDAAIEAETYTTAMKSDINLIERKAAILGKMDRIFKGGAGTGEFLSNFTLNGIIYDTDNSWAIINNKMVKTGDVLDGALVISILPQKVVLIFKKEAFDLIVK